MSILIKNIICPDTALSNSVINLSWETDTTETGTILYHVDFFNGTSWIVCADNFTRNNLLYQLPNVELSNAKFRISASCGSVITGYIESGELKIVKGTITNIPITSITTKGKITDQELSQPLLDKINESSSSGNSNPYLLVYNNSGVYKTTTNDVNSYYKGLPVCIEVDINSTGPSKLNINGLGDRDILDVYGNPMVKDGLRKSIPCNLRYNGTAFIVLGKGGGGNAKSYQILNGVTATVDSGPIIGNIPSKSGEIIIPGVSDIIIPKEIYLDGDIIIKGDNNLTENNIVNGVTIFGKTGTASVLKSYNKNIVLSDVICYNYKEHTGYEIALKSSIFSDLIGRDIYSASIALSGTYTIIRHYANGSEYSVSIPFSYNNNYNISTNYAYNIIVLSTTIAYSDEHIVRVEEVTGSLSANYV